ncbi:hypothetical protein [Caballeronia sp. Lep1P3]|uniref:DUF7683 domain-containing protein n=1 Tax=Caballeronia sp. Lep1P3 TaxID=2878150 RepID=UPI001FCFAFC1|nr:hypothetical protein [Caballeronia sp. Lep1P3]
MSKFELHRYVSAFEKNGDAHVCDVEFVEVPRMSFLQATFNVPAEDPMYDIAAIDIRIAEELRPYLPYALDLQSYDYFLECDQQERSD